MTVMTLEDGDNENIADHEAKTSFAATAKQNSQWFIHIRSEGNLSQQVYYDNLSLPNQFASLRGYKKLAYQRTIRRQISIVFLGLRLLSLPSFKATLQSPTHYSVQCLSLIHIYRLIVLLSALWIYHNYAGFTSDIAVTSC